MPSTSKNSQSRLMEGSGQYLVKFIDPVTIPASEISKINRLVYGHGIEFIPKNPNVPVPWEPTFAIEGSNVVISGSVYSTSLLSSVGPKAVSGIGSYVVKLPWRLVDRYYTPRVSPSKPEAYKEIRDILNKYGYDLFPL